MVGFILCCSLCCVIVGLGYAECCIGFRCHIQYMAGNEWRVLSVGEEQEQ